MGFFADQDQRNTVIGSHAYIGILVQGYAQAGNDNAEKHGDDALDHLLGRSHDPQQCVIKKGYDVPQKESIDKGSHTDELPAGSGLINKKGGIDHEKKGGICDMGQIGQGHHHTAEGIVAQSGQLKYTDSQTEEYVSCGHNDKTPHSYFPEIIDEHMGCLPVIVLEYPQHYSIRST